MRKQLAIGLSMLTLTGMGGVSENSFVSVEGQGVSQQYTHLVETSLNQTFEPMSGASLGPIIKVFRQHLFNLLPEVKI